MVAPRRADLESPHLRRSTPAATFILFSPLFYVLAVQSRNEVYFIFILRLRFVRSRLFHFELPAAVTPAGIRFSPGLVRKALNLQCFIWSVVMAGKTPLQCFYRGEVRGWVSPRRSEAMERALDRTPPRGGRGRRRARRMSVERDRTREREIE